MAPSGLWTRTGRYAAPMRRDAHALASIRRQHPRLWEALVADARVTARYRSERHEFRSRTDALIQILRLMVVTDAFLGQACYRLKARLQALGVPGLPRIAHRLAMTLSQVDIGDPVVVAPGLYLFHGQVVIDGLTRVGPGALIGPFVTIGLREGDLHGPDVGAEVSIGTGAKVLGRIHIGDRARIGANAVVITDVPAGAVAVGVPATVRAPGGPTHGSPPDG